MGRKDLAASQGEISAAAFLYGCAPTRLRRPTFYGHDQFSCALTKRRPSSSSDFKISRTIFAIFVRPSTVSAKSGSKRMRARRIAENAALWRMQRFDGWNLAPVLR